jgi:hypothetical protein
MSIEISMEMLLISYLVSYLKIINLCHLVVKFTAYSNL